MAKLTRLPLDYLFQLKTVCEDCGHRTVHNREDIARERTRGRLATPEEYASRLVCQPCKAQGNNGQSLSVRLILRNGNVVPIERDLRPLSSIHSVRGDCLHCGQGVSFDQEKLSEYPPELTVHDLWLRAICAACEKAGAPNPRMALEVEPPMLRTAKPAKVAWSEKEVFGEDRSDPFANLPRRWAKAMETA